MYCLVYNQEHFLRNFIIYVYLGTRRTKIIKKGVQLMNTFLVNIFKDY